MVSNTADSGPGSLRQAILDANNTPGKDTIQFNIAGSAPFAITPLSALPGISDAVVIDGTTQPGYSGMPLIGLVGTSAGTANGIAFQTSDSEVRGLFINRFAGSGVLVQGGQSNVVAGCFIGTSPNGAVRLANGSAGVTILSGRNHRIGGTNSADRNIVSGNLDGVWIAGLSATGNVVQGNFIGTDITGTTNLPNADHGVLLGAPGNLIGGTTPEARNLISGNGRSGVFVNDAFASNNWVQGNFIGTRVDGAGALSNGLDGVTIFKASGNFIGGAVLGAGNLISGNHERGVYIVTTSSNASFNRVEGNWIGTDVSGRTNLGNRFSGVGLTLANHNIIGGTNPLARNVISGNKQSGVGIDSNSFANVVCGNFIGLDATGTNVLANAFNGIAVLSGISNVIGGTAAGAGNVISGNAQNGVALTGGSKTFVLGNRIGVDASGQRGRGNSLSGVRIETSDNLIGGDAPGARNTISGNLNSGVLLFGAGASNNVLSGNFIGTDASGVLRIGNSFYGINITNAARNQIGTAAPFGGNLVSGNTNTAIALNGAGATRNVLHGNWVGLDASGTVAIPNTVGAVSFFRAGTNFLGGAEPGAGNVLSGNENVTIYVDTSNGNVIRGNFVGLRPNGSTPLPNFLHGIELLNTSSRNVIGGVNPGEGNRIANNLSLNYDGVRVRDGCVGNTIRGNAIFNSGSSGVNGLGIDWSVDGPTTTGEPRIPTLTSASGRHITTIAGSVTGLGNTTYTVDFYANTAADNSPYGEGQRWIGSVNVTTAAGGTANFNVSLTNAAGIGGLLSATSTDPAGTTSEFALTIGVTAMPDTDGDGMPNDFEQAFGLNPNSGSDADLDADGDGASNLSEFFAGTRPDSASRSFRVTMERQNDRTLLFLNSVAGETYRVEAAASVTGPWSTIADNLAGTGGILRVVDTTSGPERFFKVRSN